MTRRTSQREVSHLRAKGDTQGKKKGRACFGGHKETAQYRERKRQGVVCIARVPIYVLDVEALVQNSRLKADEQNNTVKISAAIEDLVDDFTEGTLVDANERQHQ